MIQFNLLPDIKLEYIKTKRTKRLVSLIAGGITVFSVGLMVLLFFAVNVLQKQHLNNLTEDIKKDSNTLQETPELDKILTVQNQLNSLPALHAQKPAATRLANYIRQTTPAQASIAKLDVDFVGFTMTFTGSADSLATINKFVDTLKFTTYKEGENTGSAFTDVVLSNFSLQAGKASYTINLKYNPTIFDASKEVQLIVPNIITTRSTTERPEALFQPLPPSPAEGAQ